MPLLTSDTQKKLGISNRGTKSWYWYFDNCEVKIAFIIARKEIM